MTPDFLVDLLGDEVLARRIVQVVLIVLVLIVPLGVRRLARLVLSPLQRMIKRLAGDDLGEQIIEALYPPAEFLIVIISFYVALTLLAVDMSARLQNIIEDVVMVLVLFGLFWAAHRTVDVVTEHLKRRAWVKEGKLLDTNMIRFANQIAEALIVIIGFVVIMEELGYNLNGVLAGLGLGGLAVALAAQELLKDIIGYAAIMTDEPFVIDDFVIINGTSGTVEAVGFRSTKVRQQDQAQVIIPNRIVANTAITNWSRVNKRRFDITLGIHFETPPEKIRAVTADISKLLARDERVIHDGSEFAQFVDFGESAINMRIISYINLPNWAEFQHAKADLQMQIIEILEAHGVQRALPTRNFVLNPATEQVLSGQMPEPESETASE